MPQTKAPAVTGASTTDLENRAGPSVAPHGPCASAWALSPLRIAGYEAEQNALRGFEQIADVMPEVAIRLTREMLPDPTPGDVIRRTGMP